MVETIALATFSECRTLSVGTLLSDSARKQIEEQRSIRVRRVEHIGEDGVTSPVVNDLGLAIENVAKGRLPGVIPELAPAECAAG